MSTTSSESTITSECSDGIGVYLEYKLRGIFYRIGYFIGCYPMWNVIIPIILFLSLSTGFFWFREANNVRLDFTAENSPSRYEYMVSQEFFEEKGKPLYLVATIQASDGGNLLRKNYLEAARTLESYLQIGLKVQKNLTFQNICGSYCAGNDAVHYFMTSFSEKTHSYNPNIKLTFPVMYFFGEQLYLAQNLFKIQVNPLSKSVNSVELIVLHFRATSKNQSTHDIFKLWEQKVADKVNGHGTFSPYLAISTSSEGLVTKEVKRTAMKAFPYLGLSFFVILLFTVTTSLKYDLRISKPWEAVFGVFSPLFALVTSFGLLLWLKCDYVPIVSVTPFLVLAIGVDDVFLSLHSWHKTDTSLPVPQRTALTLVDAGPSITITSLTNALSFGIGAFSPTPAIRTFCIYTSVAIFIGYLYQLFFYSALLAIGGEREARNRNPYLWCLTLSEDKSKRPMDPSWFRQYKKRICTKLAAVWTDFCVSWLGRVTVGLFLLIYWSLAFWGFTRTKIELSIDKLFLADSPILDFIEIQKTTIFKDGGQLYIFINRPGDLRNRSRLNNFMTMVHELEEMEVSHGRISTALWLNDYMTFVGLQHSKGFFDTSQVHFTYRYLLSFMKANSRWKHFINLKPGYCIKNDPLCVKSFFFITGFGNATEWPVKLELLLKWRSLLNSYSEFNATVFEEAAMFCDQMLSIGPVTKANVITALICMTVVCIFFIPNLISVLCATISVLSINVGVFGYLVLWHVDLDPISMATILMSIGFSVDFTAHISYHYFKGNTKNTKERLHHALSSIAWPMIQAGLSTVLSVIILTIVRSYMTAVFAKTVCLVVLFGLIHGLLVLPVLLTSLPFSKGNSYREQPDHSEMANVDSTDSLNWVNKREHFKTIMRKVLCSKNNVIEPFPNINALKTSETK